MTTQLTLVNLPRRPSRAAGAQVAGVPAERVATAWRLDERTRSVGLAGVARARAVLASTRRAATSGDGSEETPAAA